MVGVFMQGRTDSRPRLGRQRLGPHPASRLVLVPLVIALATVTVTVLPSQVAEAATDVVTNCSGSASVVGSLPYVVANASPGDTIDFSLSPPCPTITLASEIVLSQNVAITGPGASSLAVSGGGTVPVLSVPSGVTASISGLTMDGGYNSTWFGGGIYNDGTLTISNSSVSNNDDTPGYGGGIFNDTSGVLHITASTLSGNVTSAYGGAILNEDTVTVSNSTVSGNNATGVGGAIDNYPSATATITNSTLTDNTAEFGANINNLGTLDIGATMVTDPVTGTDCHFTTGLTDLGYNLDDDGSCNFSAGTDLSDTPAHLDSSGLQYNGGPTETIALDSGSAAIDHVSNPSQCPATDQRGAPRTTPCDIGAYDTDWGPAIDLNVSGTQTSGGGDNLTYTTNAPGGDVSGTLTCTTVDGGTSISPSLPIGDYTVDGSHCSGLASSNQAAYPIFPSSYTGVNNGFVVLAPSVWSITSSPSPGSNQNQLYQLSCTSATFCMAVGFRYDGSATQTLVETWNGTAWSVVASPDPAGTYDVLSDVSCVSPTKCEAVGADEIGSTFENLAESWNGTAWSVVSSPDQGSGNNGLLSVSCTSAIVCQAVGSYEAGSTSQTLAESWNGSTWSITSSPNQGSGDNQLNGVSCTSTTDCQAVGNAKVGSKYQTLVESWNGTSWSITSSPDQGSGDNYLYDVSCGDSSHCQAVGYDTHGATEETLVESWNGTAWSIASSPNAGSQPFLSGVSCAADASCVAVGSDQNGSTAQTLIESWDGTAWALTSSPDEGSGDNVLYGVDCFSTTACVAGGYEANGATEDTLIESSSPPPPIVSEVSLATGFTTGDVGVTITGSGFTGATKVDVGANLATDVTVTNDSTITATVPPGSAGTVDVTVTAPGGVSSATPADDYTYTVEQPSPNTEPCDPSCTTNTVSTTLNDTTVSVTGSSGGPAVDTNLTVNTGTLSCGTSKKHNYDYLTAVSTLSSPGFDAGENLTVTETVHGEPTTTGVKVCFAAGSHSTGTFLQPCTMSRPAPCIDSPIESSGSVIVTFLSPANDPRFWTGVAAADLKSFSPTKGAPGTTVTIKGKNLTQVQAVVIGGARATIETNKSSASKLVVTVPSTADSGLITVTSASGETVSTKSFTLT
jgi:hypothetical protein